MIQLLAGDARDVLPASLTPDWTEGLCGDGAAILRDGVRVTIPRTLSNAERCPGRCAFFSLKPSICACVRESLMIRLSG